MRRFILLVITHGGALAVGFALGIYMLPILTAPKSPDAGVLSEQAQGASFTADFTRDLRGSDFLHWGEGKVSLTPTRIVHEGRLAPGPDYKLYLSPEFVETKEEFLRLRPRMVRVGDIRTFTNFAVPVPAQIDPDAYGTVIVWCESFNQFITAARYR